MKFPLSWPCLSSCIKQWLPLQVYHELVVLEGLHRTPSFSPAVMLEAITRPLISFNWYETHALLVHWLKIWNAGTTPLPNIDCQGKTCTCKVICRVKSWNSEFCTEQQHRDYMFAGVGRHSQSLCCCASFAKQVKAWLYNSKINTHVYICGTGSIGLCTSYRPIYANVSLKQEAI